MPSRTIDRAALKVYDAGYPMGMDFDAVIGTPERVRVAHHVTAYGVRELLDEAEKRHSYLWDVRTYVRTRHGAGHAAYEPEGWMDLSMDEIRRRERIAGRR